MKYLDAKMQKGAPENKMASGPPQNKRVARADPTLRGAEAVSSLRAPSPKKDPDKTEDLFASDAARDLAKELDVDPAKVSGTGRDGKITTADVRKFIDEQD